MSLASGPFVLFLIVVIGPVCSCGSTPPSTPPLASSTGGKQSSANADTPLTKDPVASAMSPNVILRGDPGACLGAPPDPNEVIPPELISRKEPVLPSDVRTHGRVILSAVINVAGRVEGVQVVRSFTPAFDKACADAIREWRYTPATQHGKPVAFTYTAMCTFTP